MEAHLNGPNTISGDTPNSSFEPSWPRSDIGKYPPSMREGFVVHCIYCEEYQIGLGVVLEIWQAEDALKGVCTFERLKASLSIYYKPQFVSRVSDYYMGLGDFDSIPEMENFLDWYFKARGIFLLEVMKYIVIRSFDVHDVNPWGDSDSDKDGSSEEEGSGGEAKEAEESSNSGDQAGGRQKVDTERSREVNEEEGGRYSPEMGYRRKANVLEIRPVPISFPHHLSQPEAHTQPDTTRFQQIQTIIKQASEQIKQLLPTGLDDEIDSDNSTRTASGYLYHSTTESYLESLAGRGIRPGFHPNSLSSTGAFYLGNDSGEVILDALFRFPQLEVDRDPVAILAFEVDKRMLKRGRKSINDSGWVILSYKKTSSARLKAFVSSNMHNIGDLEINERDEKRNLTGEYVLVDVVAAPWLLPAGDGVAFDSVAESVSYSTGTVTPPLQFAFTSDKSWKFLNGAYRHTFVAQ